MLKSVGMQDSYIVLLAIGLLLDCTVRHPSFAWFRIPLLFAIVPVFFWSIAETGQAPGSVLAVLDYVDTVFNLGLKGKNVIGIFVLLLCVPALLFPLLGMEVSRVIHFFARIYRRRVVR